MTVPPAEPGPPSCPGEAERAEPVAASARAPATDAREALRRSEERFRAFVEQSAEGIWCFEVEEPVPTDWPTPRQVEGFYRSSVLTECNDAMARMYGFASAADLIGTRLVDMLPPTDPHNVEYLSAFVASGYRMMDAETAERDRDGRTRHYLNNLVGVLRDGRLVRVWGTQRDITDLKRLEAQLRHSQKMEAIGLLAGGVAHDFNNFLTSIIGFCELASRRAAGNDALLRDLAEIRRAGERAADMTRQLLAFGRRQVLEPRPVALGEVVTGVRRLLTHVVGAHVGLDLRIAPDLGVVRADAAQIEQVLVNLAANARDAMPEGGQVEIRCENVNLDVSAMRDRDDVPAGRYVMLAVADTGAGMDAETCARIFEPFFTTKAPGRGTGLGLASVYGIVNQSGGRITVRSEPGQGTVFKIYLPRVEAAVEPARPAEEVATLTPLTALLVDDNPSVRELARRMLCDDGHAVLEAGSMDEALRIARAHAGSIDLLLTDWRIPGGTGRRLATALLAERPGTVVIYMSGFTDPASLSDGGQAPHEQFLQKPFTWGALSRKIAAALPIRRRSAA